MLGYVFNNMRHSCYYQITMHVIFDYKSCELYKKHNHDYKAVIPIFHERIIDTIFS